MAVMIEEEKSSQVSAPLSSSLSPSNNADAGVSRDPPPTNCPQPPYSGHSYHFLIGYHRRFIPLHRLMVVLTAACIIQQWSYLAHMMAKQSTTSNVLLGASDGLAILPLVGINHSRSTTATAATSTSSTSTSTGSSIAVESRQQAHVEGDEFMSELWEDVDDEVQERSEVLQTRISSSTTAISSNTNNKNNNNGVTRSRTIPKGTKVFQPRKSSAVNKQDHPIIRNIHPKINIERIYYINLNRNYRRRRAMERWLSIQSIPYRRINGTIGGTTECIEQKNGSNWCKGISGLILSNLDIMDNYNTSGLTLVLEDDIQIVNWKELYRSIPEVPSDWDIIRFDCTDAYNRPSFFPPLVAQGTFQTPGIPECSTKTWTTKPRDCYFCGSTYAMLWRRSSISKLRALWSEKPYNDIDCRLSTDSLKSYCVNRNIVKSIKIKEEFSDITKYNPD